MAPKRKAPAASGGGKKGKRAPEPEPESESEPESDSEEASEEEASGEEPMSEDGSEEEEDESGEDMSDDDDDEDAASDEEEDVSASDGGDESLDELDDEEFEGDDLELGGEGGDDSSDGAGEDEFDGDDVSGGDDDDAGEGGDDEERAAAAAAAASRGEQGGANMFGFARAFSNLVGDAADGEGAGDVLPKTKKQRRQEAEARREKKVKAAEKKRKLELREKGHVVPIKGVADPSSDQLERKLLQTATRGVVRLFNAVSQAQRAAAEKKAEGGSAKKKDMSKAEFLAQLRASALGKATPAHLLGVDAEQNKEESKGGKWDVLTDGYLMGRNKMKDWDKGTREDGAKEVEYEDEDEDEF